MSKEDNYDVIYFVGNGPEDIVVLEEVDVFFAPIDSRPEVKNNPSNKIMTLPVKGGCGILDKVYQYLINEKNDK
jgi:3-deoxy-D-manno-octulosonate 8-phosphate phosphatase KdsC-like HAD superfamily phosphatase